MSASSGQNNEVWEKWFFPPKPEHDYVTYEPNLFLCFLDLVDLLEDVSRLGFWNGSSSLLFLTKHCKNFVGQCHDKGWLVFSLTVFTGPLGHTAYASICKYVCMKVYANMQVCNYESMHICKLKVNLRHVSGKYHACLRHTSGRYPENLSHMLGKYLRHFCIFVYNPQWSPDVEIMVNIGILVPRKFLTSQKMFIEIVVFFSQKWNFGKNYRFFVTKMKCWQRLSLFYCWNGITSM